MNNIFNNSLYFITALLSIVVVSCKKDDEVTKQVAPTLTQISAATGLRGTEVNLTGTNLKEVTMVKFGGTPVADFNPQLNTETSITVKVPAGVSQGTLKVTVYLPASYPNNLGASASIPFTVIEPPTITSISPAKGSPGDEVTITGRNLDIVTQVKIGTIVTAFTATGTQMKIRISEAATAGSQVITLDSPIGSATIDFEVTLLKYIIFDEALNSSWADWGGWNSSVVSDFANTEHPKSAKKALKITFGDEWKGYTLHANTAIDLSGYKSFKIAIYGGAGSNGKKVKFGIQSNGTWPSVLKEIVLTEGSYTTYEILLSDFGKPANATELVFQNMDNKDAIVYVDDMGFL